jgi:hypothetical protein
MGSHCAKKLGRRGCCFNIPFEVFLIPAQWKSSLQRADADDNNALLLSLSLCYYPHGMQTLSLVNIASTPSLSGSFHALIGPKQTDRERERGPDFALLPAVDVNYQIMQAACYHSAQFGTKECRLVQNRIESSSSHILIRIMHTHCLWNVIFN